ncbi:MAG: hypothetical protein QOJ82_1659 [Solirubrobacteraceae bacterium]|jgi:hypothetical protein|nr:hypothetical protein [Solirubrobacteraceae bacterium]MEA2393768.1 hypothetical protein [Solirubrobacteraceae bacterium]
MRKLSILVAALLAALGAIAVVVSVGSSSSHREAPLSSLDPTADDTDVYAFVAPDATNDVTLIGNWIPFEDPAGGPNFYRFDDRATYYLNVDNTGDGKFDIRYEFKFKTKIRNPSSFLYALPGVTSIGDPKLNVVQTYTVTRERFRKGRMVSSRVIARGLPVAPNNVGPKTMPNYDAIAAGAIRPLSGGRKVFAGQVDDPFFVDLGTAFDAINIRNGTGNAGGGKDDLAGYNVHSIVLQVPKSDVTRDGKTPSSAKASDAVVGVWASTFRNASQVATKTAKGKARAKGEVQVSRLGNPLVNEVIIPLGQKDRFNATQPSDDLKNFGKFVLTPELAKVINILFPGLNVPETNRTDIVTALLTGIPGLTQIAPKAPPTDSLKINLGVAPNPSPSRFGVLAGDTQGFPDGRRLGDDVIDIALRVVGGFLKGNKLPLGDGVDGNDVPYRTTFPYVAAPHAGFDSQIKRIEPVHAPTPGDPTGS